MMKKTMSMLVLVFAVMALSACGAPAQDQTADQTSTTLQDIATKNNADGTFSGTLKGLMGMGKAQKCTWSDGSGMSGVVYISGNKMHTEMKGIAKNEMGMAGDMLMISDGEWVYTWDSTTKQGMKMKDEMKDEYEEVAEDYMAEAPDDMVADMIDETYDYKCENWKADNSKFVPPTDVTFQDMNAMLENMKQGAGNMQGMCDFAPPEEKAECLEQMQGMQVDMKNIPQ